MELNQLPIFAGVVATTIFVGSYLPMLVRAVRTRNLSSYGRSSLVLANIGNLVQTAYVVALPVGPIWGLHALYLLATLMLVLHLRHISLDLVDQFGPERWLSSVDHLDQRIHWSTLSGRPRETTVAVRGDWIVAELIARDTRSRLVTINACQQQRSEAVPHHDVLDQLSYRDLRWRRTVPRVRRQLPYDSLEFRRRRVDQLHAGRLGHGRLPRKRIGTRSVTTSGSSRGA